MFAQAFRKEEGWRRGVVREVCWEFEIGTRKYAQHETAESRLFTQGICTLLSTLAEWELDGSGTGIGGASGAGGIKLTIKIIWTAYKHSFGSTYWTLRLLNAENEVEKILPKVRRIVGLEVIGSNCSTVEAVSVVKLAARMPGLREWGMTVPARVDISWMDCDSKEMVKLKTSTYILTPPTPYTGRTLFLINFIFYRFQPNPSPSSIAPRQQPHHN